MKVFSLLLLAIYLACLVASLPTTETQDTGSEGSNESGDVQTEVQDEAPDKQYAENSRGNENFYCVKKDRFGHQCIVASSERSPCSRGGTKTGCNGHGSQCTGCSVDHQKSGWMYNQMNGWCRGQGGWIVHNMGGWRHCQ